MNVLLQVVNSNNNRCLQNHRGTPRVIIFETSNEHTVCVLQFKGHCYEIVQVLY